MKTKKIADWPWLVGIMVAAIFLLVIAFAIALWLGNSASNFVAALSGLSAVALAILTAVLLILNRDLIDANREMASASQRQAIAAEKSLAELKAQREEDRARLTPHVIFKAEGISGSKGGATGQARLRVTLVGGLPVSGIELSRHPRGNYFQESDIFAERNAAASDWTEQFTVDWDTSQDREWDVLLRFTNVLGERVTFTQLARATPQPSFDLKGGATELHREKG